MDKLCRRQSQLQWRWRSELSASFQSSWSLSYFVPCPLFDRSLSQVPHIKPTGRWWNYRTTNESNLKVSCYFALAPRRSAFNFVFNSHWSLWIRILIGRPATSSDRPRSRVLFIGGSSFANLHWTDGIYFLSIPQNWKAADLEAESVGLKWVFN